MLRRADVYRHGNRSSNHHTTEADVQLDNLPDDELGSRKP